MKSAGLSEADDCAGDLRVRRPKVSRMEDSVGLSSCGQSEQHSDVEGTEVFYPAIDALVGEMKRRFLCPEMLQIAQATDTVLRLETHETHMI